MESRFCYIVVTAWDLALGKGAAISVLQAKKRQEKTSLRFSAIRTGASQGGSPELAQS